ncbi:RNA methyltransferase, TrmA family [Candidatus Hydrogenisulfobacillus filiaventi]|uniref:RNA methyltransferase, TrmA family n=1 Tax=Candidatus Hydrogenisulfobacillus filiaventi TaxID=2707344 RepID=A0A6F8ZHP9_9FIRM|nr:RNA methyltransferase, TrmA family [Candidatus Hydrogenisulfobacillus filiaventi]
MGKDGEGVAVAPDGRTLFVAGGLPGEQVRAVVDTEHARFLKGHAVAVLEPSPQRVPAPCPVFGRCGGCALQHWAYPAEAAYKENRVREALRRIARLADPPVRPIRAATAVYAYRNKAQFPWGWSAGRPVLGFYRRATHEVIPLATCAIQHPLINRVLAEAPPAAAALGLPVYDERRDSGLLRHLVVRASFSEPEGLATVVVRHPGDPRLAAFARALRQAVPELVGVAANINPERTNRIFGARTVILEGRDFLHERLLGATFRVGPTAFFQVNPRQTAVLYSLVLDAVARVPGVRRVWDLFAGVGTLAILTGRRLPQADILAVEIAADAVADARVNARLNGVHNVSFQARDALAVVEAERMAGHAPDVVIVDPPRSGLAEELVAALDALAPRALVYVSCNPDTLARDVARLPGWRLAWAQPVDLFPRTDHVETVAILEPGSGGGLQPEAAADEQPGQHGEEDAGEGEDRRCQL